MAQSKQPRSKKFSTLIKTQSEEPFWYASDSPLGSAVRYVASLSPKFHWVGLYLLNGKSFKLGPYLGISTQPPLILIGEGTRGTALGENKNLNIPEVQSYKNCLLSDVKAQSELVILIRNQTGKVLGQFGIVSYFEGAFTEEEEKKVQKVADELGELWPG